MSTNMEEIDLTQFDDDYSAAPAPESNDSKVPEGKYVAKIERVLFRNAKSSGRPMLSWELKIVEGASSVGRKVFRNNLLDSPERLGWVKKDLRTCGIEVVKLSELNLDELLDRELEVQVKHNGDNQNVYLNRLVSLGGERASGAASVTDDEIPF
jgi:hypothetical protein